MRVLLTGLTDEELVALAQQDGPGCEAEDTLVRRYQPMAHRIANRYPYYNDDIRQDAIAEAWLSAVRAVRQFDPKRKCKYVTYVHQCMFFAVKKFLDTDGVIRHPANATAYRPRRFVLSIETLHNPDGDISWESPVIDGELEAIPLRLDIQRAIEKLESPKQRTVLRMCVAGYTFDEIATEMGSTKQAANRLFASGRKNLAKMLRDER